MKSLIEVKLVDHWGSDESAALSAWTSTGRGDREYVKEDVERVVRMLVDKNTHCHSSPLESIHYRWWIKVPIFLSRQLVKHRMISPFNEMSGRYRTIPNEYIDMPTDVYHIWNVANNVPNDLDYDAIMEYEYTYYKNVLNVLKKAEEEQRITNKQYKRAREFWRGILGTGFMTNIVFETNIPCLVNILRLRTDSHAQEEIRYMAKWMYRLAVGAGNAPVCWELLKERKFNLNNGTDWAIDEEETED